jgi:DNA polymerase
MKTLTLDIETYSSADLRKTGVYRYVEEPDFDILLLSYVINGGEIKTIDLAQGEKMPENSFMPFFQMMSSSGLLTLSLSGFVSRNG